MKNLQRAHLKKTLKKNHEKLDRVSILVPKTNSFFAAFWCPFRALGRPGAQLVPEPPPRAPRMVPDPTLNDFSKIFNGFVVAFCVRPLVCHHVFCNCFGISFGLFFEFPHLSATNHQNKKHGGGFCAQRTEIMKSGFYYTKMKRKNP